MIAHIQGKIAEKFAGSVIVDVSGVGYEIIVPETEYNKATLGEGIKFYTYHHIREQSQELFGFSSLAAKKLFELLITVQGIGPKAAIAISCWWMFAIAPGATMAPSPDRFTFRWRNFAGV